MSDILSSLLQGSATAIAAIQSYFTMPTVAGVRIDAASYKETGQNDVSEQLIIDASEGKKYQTDNVAVKPRRWELSGYLSGYASELSSAAPILMPSLFDQKARLRRARTSRQVVEFQPLYKEELWQAGATVVDTITGLFSASLKVYIENLAFENLPDAQNKVKVDLTLKEVPVLTVVLPSVENASTPQAATNPAAEGPDMGSTSTTKGQLTLPGVL